MASEPTRRHEAPIGGRYLVLEELGEGAAARVFKARDLELDRTVAVKLLTGTGVVAAPERFVEEARVLARLTHPSILAVYDSGIHQGRPYLVLELAEGGGLLGRLRERGAAAADLERWARQVLDALDQAHGAGIMHRDVKPENVLLTREGDAKLADFGLATHAGSGVHTASGMIVGTAEFLAPELFAGAAASPASDVYSWGCLAYFMINGKPPHLGTLPEIARASLSGTFARGRETGRLKEAIEAALQREPTARPSARVLAARLGGDAAPLPAPRPSAVQKLPAGPAPRAGTGPVGGSPGWIRWAAVGLAALALLAALRLLGPRPEAGPEAPGRLLALEWRRRGREIRESRQLALMQKILYPRTSGEGHPRDMQKCRKGDGCSVEADVLQHGFETTPYAGQLGPDREALLAWFASPHAAPAEKRELVEALFDAATIDAAAEAWGRPPPLGAKALLGAVVPVRIRPAAKGPLAPLPAPPASGSLPRGSWLLAGWTSPDDRRYPWLAPTVGQPTTAEMIGVAIARSATEGRWTPENHLKLAGSADLGPDPASLEVRIRVRFLLGNFRTPTMLRLAAGRLVLPIFAAADDRRQDWDFDVFPEEEVEVDLPAWALVPGLNDFELTTRPMAGLPRWRGVDADRLALALE